MPYGLTLITAPSLTVWTAATLRPRLRVDSTLDTLADELIAEATEKVQNDLSRQLLTATYELLLDGFPSDSDKIKFPIAPVASVTWAQYLDTDGDWVEWDSDLYRLVNGQEPAFITPVYGEVWPEEDIDPGAGTVKVRFVAGWASVAALPRAYRQAVSALVAHWLEHPEAVLAGTIATELPQKYAETIDGLRWTGPG